MSDFDFAVDAVEHACGISGQTCRTTQGRVRGAEKRLPNADRAGRDTYDIAEYLGFWFDNSPASGTGVETYRPKSVDSGYRITRLM